MKKDSFIATLLLLLTMVARTEADLIIDLNSLASLQITSAASPAPATGFLTYSFIVTPLNPLTEISSIDASFTGAAFRQVNPTVGLTTFPTIFNNNNALFVLSGENTNGLGDTQFEFDSTSLTVIPGSASESTTGLAAAFTGFTPILTARTIAHVVMPGSESGIVNLELAVRPQGGGVAQLATFSNIAFGAVAVPEASSAAYLAIAACATGGVRLRRWKRERIKAAG